MKDYMVIFFSPPLLWCISSLCVVFLFSPLFLHLFPCLLPSLPLCVSYSSPFSVSLTFLPSFLSLFLSLPSLFSSLLFFSFLHTHTHTVRPKFSLAILNQVKEHTSHTVYQPEWVQRERLCLTTVFLETPISQYALDSWHVDSYRTFSLYNQYFLGLEKWLSG